MQIRRWSGILAGATALFTIPFQYFVVDHPELGRFAFGNPADWGTDAGPAGLYRAAIENAAGGAVAGWVLLATMFAAGTVVVGYLSIRMVFAGLRKTRFGDVASAIIVLSYVFVGWICTQLLSPYLLLVQGFWGMSRPAFWVACVSIALGSIVREVTRE